MEIVASRHYFFCRHCGTFHFPEAVDEGIRVLEREPTVEQRCGVCRVPLATAVLDGGFSARYCERCRGVLLPRQHFAEVVQTRRWWARTPPASPVPLDQRELARTIRCPECASPMLTHPYYGPGNVVLDTCSQCDLVWLDFRELTQITNAPGQDRGRGGRHLQKEPEPDLFSILSQQFGNTRERREPEVEDEDDD
jgi:Zn-finger nucleic acid-binding protein